MIRGWFPFYRSSVALGLRRLLTGHLSREAVIRVVAPIEDSRFFELPATVAALAAEPGQRVLDLASPKLAAVSLARSGAEVTSVDLFQSEIDTWRDLAGHVDGLELQVADGRRLPFADESFDHAYSISVLEHVAEDGDLQALAELARVVKPGGRIVFTVPFDTAYREDWRDAPLYGGHVPEREGKWFFQRIYDDARLDRLVASSELVRPTGRRVVSFAATWLYRLYQRTLPAGLVLGPLVGMSTRVVESTPGLAFVTLERRPAEVSAGG